MKIKLIALDMDGTLLDSDHVTIPPRNLSALRAAAARGVLIVLATGRCWSLLSETAETLGVARYAVLANGASALDLSTGACLFQHGLPEPQWKSALSILRELNLPFEVYCEGMNYVEHRFLPAIMEIGQNFSSQYCGVFERHTAFAENLDFTLTGRGVEKIHIFYVPPNLREVLTARLAETGPATLSSALSQNLEFAAEGITKGGTLKALCSQLNLPAQAVMAFGDAGNDLEMLSWAGWSFAMENASPQAKAAARYHTAANYDAGVGQAVETYVLTES